MTTLYFDSVIHFNSRGVPYQLLVGGSEAAAELLGILFRQLQAQEVVAVR